MNRLQANQRPSWEQLGDSFCRGLRRQLKSAVAGHAPLAQHQDFGDLVDAAMRAERRYGTTTNKKSKRKQSKDDSDS